MNAAIGLSAGCGAASGSVVMVAWRVLRGPSPHELQLPPDCAPGGRHYTPSRRLVVGVLITVAAVVIGCVVGVLVISRAGPAWVQAWISFVCAGAAACGVVEAVARACERSAPIVTPDESVQEALHGEMSLTSPQHVVVIPA